MAKLIAGKEIQPTGTYTPQGVLNRVQFIWVRLTAQGAQLNVPVRIVSPSLLQGIGMLLEIQAGMEKGWIH